ncbi:MAG: 50S ribosomal protein L24 [Candidatus Pacearchaeota archaeon]
MKKEFSTHWKQSSQTRKQRKYLANAPMHIKRKIMSVNLSKELRKRYSRRSFPIRKGDDVVVMSGKFKKKSGKISGINSKKMKVSIDGINMKKNDGTKVNVYFRCSNLQIQNLDLNDKKRISALERKIHKSNSNKKEIKGDKNASEKSNNQ